MSNLANSLDTHLLYRSETKADFMMSGGPSRNQIIEKFRCALFCLTGSEPVIGFIGAFSKMSNLLAVEEGRIV